MSEHVVLMTTAPDPGSAAILARTLVAERLAACVQVLAAQSFYVWKGEATASDESLLLIKTRTALQARVADRIAALHAYEVPEIIATPVTFGAPAYLAWVDAQTEPSQ